MSLKSIIRTLIREEMSGVNEPAPVESTAPAVPQRAASFARLAILKEQATAIETRQSNTLSDVQRMAQLEVELDEIRQRVQAHRLQAYCDQLDNELAIERELVVLRSTYSPQLDAFIELMRGEHGRLLSLKPIERFSFGEKNILCDNPTVPRYEFSTAPIIGRRVLAVTTVLSRAEELKLLDRTEEELRAELDGLKSALPTIDGCYELAYA